MAYTASRVALVTGASSGFGLLTAVELARRGYTVVAAMRDPVGRGERLREAAAREGLERLVVPARLDVTDASRAAAVVAETVASYGRLDALVNNAGFAQGGFVEDVALEALRAQFETNVWGAIAVTKAALPHMRKQRSGKIINMSSVSGRIGIPGFAPYAASKFALEGFSEALRHEMRPHGVFVVLVEPASYRTEIWDKGFAGMAGGPESAHAAALARMRRMAEQSARKGGDPQDVARLVGRIADARRPKLRYAIPRSARWMLAAKHALPWAWYEAAIGRFLR